MKDFLKSSLLAIIIFSLTSSTAFTEPVFYYQPKDDTFCNDKRPYMVGFFNGVGNDYAQASKNKKALQELYGDVQYGLPVEYTLFYNQTKGYHRDILETFTQKYEEMGFSVNDGQSFSELFFYILELSRSDDATGAIPEDELTKAILELIKKTPELKEFIADMLLIKNEKQARKQEELVKNEYNTVTVEDYQTHIKQLKTLLDKDYKVILIGHSQGTLFVNNVYNKVVGNADSSRHNMQDYVLPYYIAPVAAPDKLRMYKGYNTILLGHKSYLTDNLYYRYELDGYDVYVGDRIITDVRYVLSSEDKVIERLGRTA